ncbi:MAG TPA: lipopolysaccharide kinase InaA family protein [Candidatus Binataceae bacterium]|nr:lipopolysaccharide kinase InaA family protein [Candidatus Binataceae bacterium]
MNRPAESTQARKRAPTRPPPRLPRNFISLAACGYDLFVRENLSRHADRIAAFLNALRSGGDADGRGNRASGFRLELNDQPALFVRRCRRGGAMRHLFDDLYFGANPRPLVELRVAAEALRRGIPTVEPFGAAVRWVAPLAYRGFFITRAAAGMTLWEFIRTDDDPHVRGHVLANARSALEAVSRGGLFHPDLNLNNLFVTRHRESFDVVVLDLDKARLFDHPLGPAMRRRMRTRIAASAHKLDPAGRFLDAHALKILIGN